MPVCPTCGMPFSYTETHVCEGRDKTKIWLLALVAVGALVGAPLGRLYGLSVIGQACDRPGAGNLCGMIDSFALPFYVVIGAVIGAAAAAFAVTVLLARRKA